MLFGHVPLQEIKRRIIVGFKTKLHQFINGFGDTELLLEGGLKNVFKRFLIIRRLFERRDTGMPAGRVDIAEQFHHVLLLFLVLGI